MTAKRVGRAAGPPLTTQIAAAIALLTAVPMLVTLASIGVGAGSLPGESVLQWVVLVVAVIAAASVVARALVAPVRHMASVIAAVDPTEMHPGAVWKLPPVRPLPAELEAVRVSVDNLLGHLHHAMRLREEAYEGMAHDLRTPLIAAHRALVLIQRPETNADDRARLLTQLVRDHARLVAMIGDVVEAQRWQRVQGRRVHVRFQLEDVVRDIVDAQGPAAAERGVRIIVSGESSCQGDREAITRAVENLLVNAVRHAHSSVAVNVGRVYIAVTDDGPGMPEDVAHRLAAGVASVPGTAHEAGLGLSVVDAVARMHGGRLRIVRSDDSGTELVLFLGSEFNG